VSEYALCMLCCVVLCCACMLCVSSPVFTQPVSECVTARVRTFPPSVGTFVCVYLWIDWSGHHLTSCGVAMCHVDVHFLSLSFFFFFAIPSPTGVLHASLAVFVCVALPEEEASKLFTLAPDQQLRLALDRGETDFDWVSDPNAVAGLVLIFLHELPDPLIPQDLRDCFLGVAGR
jgi:hypothetical protein